LNGSPTHANMFGGCGILVEIRTRGNDGKDGV
jgi:hypothetical protein